MIIYNIFIACSALRELMSNRKHYIFVPGRYQKKHQFYQLLILIPVTRYIIINGKLDSIPGRVKPKNIKKLEFTGFVLG